MVGLTTFLAVTFIAVGLPGGKAIPDDITTPFIQGGMILCGLAALDAFVL